MSKLDPSFLARPITHRGLHDKSKFIYENSRSAFQAAIDLGLPIECDIQCTSDQKAIVFHDATLDRLTTEIGNVFARTLAELTQITLGKSPDTIQSLPDFLEQVSGRVPLLIEIKDQSGELGPEPHAFLNDVVLNLKRYNGDFALMSFNPYQIAYLRNEMPEAALGLVTDNFLSPAWPDVPKERAARLNELQEIPDLEIDFVSHNRSDLARVQNLDMPKLCWTVKSKKDEENARLIANNITFEQYIPDFK